MDPLSPESFIGQGRTAEVFAWQENQIIKLFYNRCPPELAQSELQKSRMISSLDLPTPKFIELVEIDGRMGLVYERVFGISMLEMINTRPWLLFRLARQLAELHTIVHKQDGTDFPSIRSELNSAIEWVTTLPINLPTEALQILHKLPEGNMLCHFDFHPDQIMMTAQGPVILDWATAHQGYPLADVARTTILLKISQVPYGSQMMRAFINFWRGLFLETYLSHYFKLNPALSRKTLTSWLIPVAVGRLNEGIAGEQKALLRLINSSVAELRFDAFQAQG